MVEGLTELAGGIARELLEQRSLAVRSLSVVPSPLSLSLTHTLSLSLPLSRTHTHTYTHTHTLSYTGRAVEAQTGLRI